MVEEIKSVPCVPVSHPFVERLIGTIRREFLDHVLIWNAMDLEHKLEEFRIYYNENRVHQSPPGLLGRPCRLLQHGNPTAFWGRPAVSDIGIRPCWTPSRAALATSALLA